ncbi:hypothetical protein [Sphingopyxis granuli]|uniref:Uncharacterized protein n=1 Tax=Sphingopyxis granuli TaxID=267128 RepID=A0AA86GJ52_9SPHN|nr:hypothetical protein [Sphingopyxis granuli]AMG73739.1 Uncharacterized protein SGRAN_1350 [Sphingopyxis granuli]
MSNTNPPQTATGEPTPPAAPTLPPLPRPEVPAHLRGRKRGASRWGGCLPWAAIVGVLLLAFLIWKFPSFKAQAELGSAYAARVGCSCRYVQGRSLESCQSDFEPGMELVSLSEDPATKTVTGSVPLLASRSARYAGANGCLLDPVR